MAAVLLAGMFGLSIPSHALLVTTMSQERPAGCHQHGERAPRPQGIDYSCCISGHDVAVISPVFLPQPPNVQALPAVSVANPIMLMKFDESGRFLQRSFTDPPRIYSLRI
jgi:hypothetical protein